MHRIVQQQRPHQQQQQSKLIKPKQNHIAQIYLAYLRQLMGHPIQMYRLKMMCLVIL